MTTASSKDQQFETLYRKFAPIIYRRSLKILGNEIQAQDILQEVSLAMFHHLKKFLAHDNQTAWIYRVTTNACLNVLRQEKRAQVYRDEQIQIFAHASSWETSPISSHDLKKVLVNFSVWHQEVIIYHYMLGMNQFEIAEVTGKARITVSRALATVKQKCLELQEKSGGVYGQSIIERLSTRQVLGG